jgi:uncharacterized protein (TIGR02145 family)
LENCPGVPCATTTPFVCGTSMVNDIDGNTYNTVLIGSQCFTKENLKTTKYNDGSNIPDETNISPVSDWQNLTSGARTSHAHRVNYVAVYGYLYNAYAVHDSRKLCPLGWSVPTEAEWTTLRTHLGGSSIAGRAMKATTLWVHQFQSNNEDNSSGFSALPGDRRQGGGTFFDTNPAQASLSLFWSSTAVGSSTIQVDIRMSSSFSINSQSSFTGGSVRCIKTQAGPGPN